MVIKTKAPAKLILIGEHAVVWGEPAIVMPVNLYISVKLETTHSKKIRFKQNNIKLNYSATLEEIFEYKVDPQNQKSEGMPIAILQELNKYYKLDKLKGTILSIDSEIKFKGMGASSAFVTAMLKALFKFLKIDDNDLLHKISIDAESRFHGYQSSGVDQAVIIQQTPIFYQIVNDKILFTKFPYSLRFLKNILVINTGKVVTSTGESVNYVKKRLESEPDIYKPIIIKMGQLTKEMKLAVKNEDRKKVYKIVDGAESQLEKLGVVTDTTKRLIQVINSFNGHTKISGAGAIRGSGSGVAICFADDFTKIELYLNKQNIDYFKLKLK